LAAAAGSATGPGARQRRRGSAAWR
jgi:hypothetical protein